MSSERTFQQRVVGALALALWVSVLACGGRIAAESENTGPSSAAPRAAPAFVPPARSAPTAPRSAPPTGRRPGVPREPMHPPPQPDYNEPALARAATENILGANCGVCHGYLAEPAMSGGIRFITDLNALVAAGLIVPFSSEGSRIVQVMELGSMPPRASGYPPVTPADIEVISGFIDNPRYWPDWPYAPPDFLDAGTEPTSPDLDAGTPTAFEPGADAG